MNRRFMRYASIATAPMLNQASLDNHKLYKGSNCEADAGKPRERYQPRNSKCVCGSGKKAKACCVIFPEEKK